MQRKRGELVPIGEASSGLDGPVKAIREASPQARHHFTLADQVNQLVSASEADPDLGFMARMMALCSLPRTNPGNRIRYTRQNGPYTLLADRTEFWWNERKPDERVLWDSKIRLGEDFFNEIINRPVPIDMNTLTALKRCALGLDLYLWLTYRTFALTRPLRLTWRQVYQQFGLHPAKASDKRTVLNFRRKILRELKKIKLAWPDLNYTTAPGLLILHPSTPGIAPLNQAQLTS